MHSTHAAGTEPLQRNALPASSFPAPPLAQEAAVHVPYCCLLRALPQPSSASASPSQAPVWPQVPRCWRAPATPIVFTF